MFKNNKRDTPLSSSRRQRNSFLSSWSQAIRMAIGSIGKRFYRLELHSGLQNDQGDLSPHRRERQAKRAKRGLLHKSIKYQTSNIKHSVETSPRPSPTRRGSRGRYALLFFATLILLLAPIAFFTLNKPTQTEASWFDDSFGFRKRIPINNSSGEEQTDFQVELELDTATLITAEKLQDDCDDLRFTASDGKVLPYWLEPNTCNTATTKVFVKVPKIPTTGADIFWYYGNPQASSASQSDQVFIREMDSAVAAWPLDDEEQTQSYARVINPYREEGRNIVINGTFDSDTGWTKGTGWTIENGVAISDGTQNPSQSHITPNPAIPLISGKFYEVTFTLTNYGGSGFIRPIIQGDIWGTNRTANGTYTEILKASSGGGSITFTASATFTGSIDNIIVKQVNIPSSSTLSTNLLADGDMESADASAWTSIGNSLISKNNTNPFEGNSVLRVAYNGTTSPAAGAQQTVLTIGKTYRVYGYARSDSTFSPRVRDSLGTMLWTGTNSTSWQPFDFVYVATVESLRFDSAANINGGYVEFDSVVVTEDTSIRPGELLQDGDMEASGTGVWKPQFGAVLSKETDNPHAGSQVFRIYGVDGTGRAADQSVLVIGKTYRATGWMRSSGSSLPRLSNGFNVKFTGTTSTDWQYFDVTFVATDPEIR